MQGQWQSCWTAEQAVSSSNKATETPSAMATASSPTKVEQEAMCPICTEYLTDPVSVDCGHNYCRGCITKYCETWEELGEDLECPVCRAQIQRRNFRHNWQLANIVAQIKLLVLNPERDGMCERHNETLHLFCKEDEVLVCWKCKQSPEHELHTVLLKEEASQEYKGQIHHRLDILRKEKGKILTYKADTEKKNQDVLAEIQAEKEKAMTQFRQLHQFLEEQEKLLLAQMDEAKEEIARRREEHQARLSEELSSLQSIIQEMEEKSQQPPSELLQDMRNILQRSEKETCENPVAFPPELKGRIWDFCDKNSFLEGAMKQFKDTLLPGLQPQQAPQQRPPRKPQAEPGTKPQAESVCHPAANVTLDPNTAHPQLILYEDRKSVVWGDCNHHLPDNPERFDLCSFVLGREGFTTGRHCWNVTVENKILWAVGVARKSVRRKGLILLCPEQGIWSLLYAGGACMPAHLPLLPLSLSGELRRIRVSLNCDGGEVAFYDAHRGTLLYAFTGISFSGETILPFFHLCGNGYLSISP